MVSKGSVLITDCSDGGIGSALARAFAVRGFRVFATARNTVSMAKLQDLSNITLLSLNMLDTKQVGATVASVSKETGGTLDYLVNHAGRNRFMPLLDENIEKAKKLYDTNFWCPLRLLQAFSLLFIGAKGTVVFISSVSGYLNVPWQGIYSASKRSLEIIGNVLRLKPKNHTHYQGWKMPDHSHYISVQEYFVKREKADDGVPRMNPQKHAEDVVNKLLGSPGPKIRYGVAASVVKFATSWFLTS